MNNMKYTSLVEQQVCMRKRTSVQYATISSGALYTDYWWKALRGWPIDSLGIELSRSGFF